MIPLFRSFISLPAGVERMRLTTFVTFTTLGSLVWNTIFVVAGYLLGENWYLVEEYAGLLSRAVLVVVVLAVAVFIGLRIRRARRDEEFAEAPTVQLEAVQVGSSSTWGDELSWDETPTQEIRRW